MATHPRYWRLQMEFTRPNYWGLLLDWYAVDAAGNVAVLISGEGLIPKILFNNEERYTSISDYFQNCPQIYDSTLSNYSKKLLKKHKTFDPSEFHKQSRRGLFSYYERSDDGFDTPNYDLYAIPTSWLNVAKLPKEIAEFLVPFRIKIGSFADAQSLNVLDYFECDV